MLYTIIAGCIGLVVLASGVIAFVRRPHNNDTGDHVAASVLTRINAEYNEHRH